MDLINALPLFQHDEAGFAVPALTVGCSWVIEKSCLVTIKLDGINVKVKGNQLYRLEKSSVGGSPFYVMCSEYFVADQALVAAFRNAAGAKSGVLPDGIYEAFGPGIKGNPHGAEEPYMLRVAPMDGPLMISPHQTKIKCGYGVNVQELYAAVKAELEESPEIEGIVFQWEKAMMQPELFAVVERKDFGLPWPVVAS